VSDQALRVVLFGLPRLLDDLVRRAAAARDDVIVADEREDALRAAADGRDTALITETAGGTWPPGCDALIRERTSLRLYGVDGREGVTRVLELHPASIALGELTADELLDEVVARAGKAT
jgi:hypothetical protein